MNILSMRPIVISQVFPYNEAHIGVSYESGVNCGHDWRW